MAAITITPEILLRAYRAGLFPMAEDAASEDELMWFDPPERAIFPLDGFHIPRRLRRTIRRQPYRLTVNQDFPAVMQGCAAPSPRRSNGKTWINAEITGLYTALHRQGHAHSLEAWHENRLVGGLYGVHLGRAFFGESMFSTMTDASKICLAALVAILRRSGFQLLDCQFMTGHLRQFGAVIISRAAYRARLDAACAQRGENGAVVVGSAAGTASAGTYPGTGTGSAPSWPAGFTPAGAVSGALMAFLQETTHTS